MFWGAHRGGLDLGILGPTSWPRESWPWISPHAEVLGVLWWLKVCIVTQAPGLRSHRVKVGDGAVSTCLIDLLSHLGTWRNWVSYCQQKFFGWHLLSIVRSVDSRGHLQTGLCGCLEQEGTPDVHVLEEPLLSPLDPSSGFEVFRAIRGGS